MLASTDWFCSIMPRPYMYIIPILQAIATEHKLFFEETFGNGSDGEN